MKEGRTPGWYNNLAFDRGALAMKCAIEAIMCIKAMEDNFVPPTINLEESIGRMKSN